MNVVEALYSIIESFFKSKQIEIYSQPAKVKNVDKKSFSCEVELLRGGSRKFARLSAKLDNGSGLVIFPQKNSQVIVTFLDSTTVFITSYTDIDEIVYHDGANGGLVKVNEIVSHFTKISNDLTTLQLLLKTHPVAGNGAPLGLVFTPTATSPTITQFENPKFKH